MNILYAFSIIMLLVTGGMRDALQAVEYEEAIPGREGT